MENVYYDEYYNKFYNPDDDDASPGDNLNWKKIQRGFKRVEGAAAEDYTTLNDKIDEAVADLESEINDVFELLHLDKGPIIDVSVSGSAASFSDGANDMPVKSLIVSIKPVQSGSGDPSPDNIRPISGWTKATVQQNSTALEIAFPTEAGTVYGGTLDVTNGVLTKKWEYKTFATLSETVSYLDGMFVFVAISRIARNTIEQFLCSKYANYGNDNWSTLKNSMPDKSFGTTSVSAQKFVCFKDSDYTTVADFMAANADTQIAWEIKEEYWTEYQLTPTEVKTMLGVNNISADTGDIVNLEYRVDTKLYIDRLTDPDSDMIADANITSGSYFLVNNSLYIATAAIAAGETIVPGTNCTLTNLAAALNALNA